MIFPKSAFTFLCCLLCGWELTHMQKIQLITTKKKKDTQSGSFLYLHNFWRTKPTRSCFSTFRDKSLIFYHRCERCAGEYQLLAACCSAPLVFNRCLCVCVCETVCYSVLSVISTWVWLVLQVTKEIAPVLFCIKNRWEISLFNKSLVSGNFSSWEFNWLSVIYFVGVSVPLFSKSGPLF